MNQQHISKQVGEKATKIDEISSLNAKTTGNKLQNESVSQSVSQSVSHSSCATLHNT